MAIGKRDIIRIPQASNNILKNSNRIIKNNKMNLSQEKSNDHIDDDGSSSVKRKIKLSRMKKKQLRNQQGQGGELLSNEGGRRGEDDDVGI